MLTSLELSYTHDELIFFRNSYHSRTFPKDLDTTFINERGHWDPDKWIQSLQFSSCEETSRRDPKERIKSENEDGIILSPQRRSFLSGCQPDLESSRPERRSAGSGRIPSREEGKFGRFSRHSTGEESKWSRRSNSRFPSQRVSESEPEWMSEPISQSDILELRGFETTPSPKELTPHPSSPKGHEDFNLDDFLHMDTIPPGLADILTDDSSKNKTNSNGGAEGSRFSQFFQPRKPPSMSPLRIPSPGDSSNYFAPISPASKTNQSHSISNSHLLNMLRKVSCNGNTPTPIIEPVEPHKIPSGNVRSVRELEAGFAGLEMRKTDELSVFKKFAALVEGNVGIPSQERVSPILQQTQLSNHSIVRPCPLGPIDSYRHSELLHYIHHSPYHPEILQLPEARTLQLALSNGNVSLDVLLQQFATGNLPPFQRTILLNVLKVQRSLFPPHGFTTETRERKVNEEPKKRINESDLTFMPTVVMKKMAAIRRDSEDFSSRRSETLSRFFSPEILSNVPVMPPLPTIRALTLEEIESQASVRM